MLFTVKRTTTALTTLFALLALAPFAVQAAPVNSCTKQHACLDITKTQVENSCSAGSSCTYEICLIINSSKGGCNKSGAWSHSCVKDSNVCTTQKGFAGATNLSGPGNQCQRVIAGEKAYFLMKDGNGCADSKLFDGGRCYPRPNNEKSCSGNGVGKECVWEIAAPTTCSGTPTPPTPTPPTPTPPTPTPPTPTPPTTTTATKTSGAGGDPHIKRWDGTRYYYHGECDLVLIQNDDFNKGEGFDIHIRTTIEDYYSFIENVAIRVGDSVLEITKDQVWIDGREHLEDDLPATLKEGYTVGKSYYQIGQKGKFQDIILNNGNVITLSSYKGFMAVNLEGLKDDFEHSMGMLGHYHTGKMLSRDGETVYDQDDTDNFGSDWQVQGSDPRLFQTERAPVFPTQCNFPTQSEVQRRRQLRSDPEKVKEAEAACAHKSVEDFSYCVFDVLATDDVHMAGVW